MIAGLDLDNFTVSRAVERFTRPNAWTTLDDDTRKELIEGADTLFAAVISGTLHVPINHAYALKDAQKAHRDLESRVTTGSGILKP